jgi:hypothetical protein
MKSISIGVVLFLSILWVSAARAEIYTWTDAKGIKHYSDQPPENVKNARVVFPEYQYDEAADKKRFDMEQEEWNTLIDAIEAEDRKDKEAKSKRAEEAEQNRAPTQQELIVAEQQRLEQKIAELEEQPLEFFGSQKNKRVRIGYYRYRLEALLQNPDEYFKNPQGFEGNVKNPIEVGN